MLARSVDRARESLLSLMVDFAVKLWTDPAFWEGAEKSFHLWCFHLRRQAGCRAAWHACLHIDVERTFA